MTLRHLASFALLLLVSCSPRGGGDAPPDDRPLCRAECSTECGQQCPDICSAMACWADEGDAWQLVAVDCQRGCSQPSDAGVDADVGAPPSCGTPPDSHPLCRSGCSYQCGMQCSDICGAFGCWDCVDTAWQFVSYDCEQGCGQPSDASVGISP